MWGYLKHIFRPRTIVFTLGGIGTGAALIASPLSPFGAAIAGGIGLITGYMFYDMANKHEISERLKDIERQNHLDHGQLTADQNYGPDLVQYAQANNMQIIPVPVEISSSTLAILNKIGNGVGAALVTSGLILQGIALAPANTQSPSANNTNYGNANTNSNSKSMEILGTALAGAGLGVSLLTHWLTAPFLRKRLKEAETIRDNLVVLEKTRAINENVDSAIEREVNNTITGIIQRYERSAGDEIDVQAFRTLANQYKR